MASSPIIRTSRTHNRFVLDSHYFIRGGIPNGKAATVYATPELGTWATQTLEVKKVAGKTSFSFASPKTIAAGGGHVSLSSTELEGVDEIEVVTSGSAAASGARATVTITIEQDSPVVVEDGFFPPGFDTGPMTRPGLPPIDL